MSKVAVGSIPDKITYVFSDQREVAIGCEWDISWYESDDGTKTVKQKVTPSFPVDSSDTKMMDRAISWAVQGGYDYQTNKPITKPHTTIEIENKPITNVKVLSLEHRGQGGRAYKALIDNFYVDLREDVLMDTLLQVGVKPGGVLQGEYVWAKMNSQMKLVRVGSELHRLIVEFESKKDIKPVGKKDLEIGGIYQDRKKNKVIFLGYVNTVKYEVDGNPSAVKDPNFKFHTKSIKKAMIFYSIYTHEKLDNQIEKMLKIENSYSFNIKKSHTYIEKVDQLDLPEGLIAKLRDKAIAEIKQDILEFTGYKPPKRNYAKIDAGTLVSNIVYKSEHLNLYEYGKKEVEPFDVKKLLIFS